MSVFISLVDSLTVAAHKITVQIQLRTHSAYRGTCFIRLRIPDQIRCECTERIHTLNGVGEFNARKIQRSDFLHGALRQVSACRAKLSLIHILLQEIQACLIVHFQDLGERCRCSLFIRNIGNRIAR